jgi:hypothetical protein
MGTSKPTHSAPGWQHENRDCHWFLVTHQVNITELTSIIPASGELVFASMNASGRITVIDRQSAEA